ncbi:hypothetical protein ACQ4M3_22010 [Leptolyngbya sp. AN03gr2]|uniref:hypothetical protein n=1 Tax=unclassified Leptolyngbya TaxID=2650499 RepID=UPI003D30FC7E
MNLFILVWSLISPLCLGIVASVFWSRPNNWHPASSEVGISLLVYSAYWLLLGGLQAAALFWRFRDRRFAVRWFLVTSATGILVMLLHDLTVFAITGALEGQGVLFLGISFSVLAVLGGLVLGAAQFLLIRQRDRVHSNLKVLRTQWFVLSWLSWVIGFAGIPFVFYSMFVSVFVTVAVGSALKGWFLQKYLND